VGEQPGEIVSPGQVVKAMLLNGLGLVSAPLYLFSSLTAKFKVTAQLELNSSVVYQQTLACGRFILATNVMDVSHWTLDKRKVASRFYNAK